MNKIATKATVGRGRQALHLQRRRLSHQMNEFIGNCASLNPETIDARSWFVETLCRLLPVKLAGLLFVQESNTELVVFQEGHAEIQLDYPADFPQEGGLVENCLASRAAAVVNTPQELAGRLFEPLSDLHPARLLCVPLVHRDRALGAIILLDKAGGPFTHWDETFITQVAGIIARSIYYANQVKQLSVANAELEVNRWQLIRSRNTLRTLFDSVPISIYIIDREYRLCAVNMDKARRIHQPPNKLVGLPCYKAFYGRDDVCPDCHALATFHNGQTQTRVKRQWEDDTEPLEWEINTYPIHDDNNHVIQTILFEQDVTEKRRLESSLIQSEKLAAVGQLAAGIAHEINNPLTAILANAQMLHREIPEEDDRQELVDLITRAGTRASQVVRNLLDLARKENYNFAPTDINDTVRRAVELLQHEINARSVDLGFQPAAGLPAINASTDHLQGVWINLLSNAMDALENGRNKISIETRHQGNEIQVIFTDTGKGIPLHSIPRIFEPFYTTKSPGHGTGLGLSFCHRVIKQHGGMIHVDSQMDQGTQFIVSLPVS